MMRYVAFLVLGCAFVSGLWVTVQTYRLYEQTESAMVATGASAIRGLAPGPERVAGNLCWIGSDRLEIRPSASSNHNVVQCISVCTP
jgi:hypothetical protein